MMKPNKPQTIEATLKNHNLHLISSDIKLTPFEEIPPAPGDKELDKLGSMLERSLSVPTSQRSIVMTAPVRDRISPGHSSNISTDSFVEDHQSNLVKDNSNRYRDVDGGYAWVILAAVFTINSSIFGTARAYGLIFDKLARQDNKSRAEAALPFTIMGTVENMAGPLSGYLLAKTNSWRTTVFLGSLMITVAHLLASIAETQMVQLISMGLMCGLGQSLVMISFFQINNAYFVRYRSTAFGFGLTGAAFGTLYISPLCRHILESYGTSMCYLILSLILLPNVALSLLLKPRDMPSLDEPETDSKRGSTVDFKRTRNVRTISGNINPGIRAGVWVAIRKVISNPLFHLIWPTQLLFCWLNFVIGMIVSDFGKDRGLAEQSAQLVPIWAFGQLAGRMVLGSLVDLKFISYKSFTVICFTAIGITTWSLNNVRVDPDHQALVLSIILFILSMFIALLYILFNGLVVNYVETSLQSLSIGISSFAGSFFLVPRANIIGYYHDTYGNYDSMLTLFTYISLSAALVWLIMPTIGRTCRKFRQNTFQTRGVCRNETLSQLPVYPSWKLDAVFKMSVEKQYSMPNIS